MTTIRQQKHPLSSTERHHNIICNNHNDHNDALDKDDAMLTVSLMVISDHTHYIIIHGKLCYRSKCVSLDYGMHNMLWCFRDN